MRDEIARILQLQRVYSSENTPAMQERGLLIRHVVPSQIREVIQPANSWVEVKGRDHTGRKSRVPWIRLFDRLRSPTPRDGWYAVYLFNEDGSGFVLSLNQGTTDFTEGEFRQLDSDLIERRVSWARERLPMLPLPSGTTDSIWLGNGDLARGYARGHVVGYAYSAEVPDDERLRTDLNGMLGLLRAFYDLAPVSPLPGSPDPLIEGLKADIESEAGKLRAGGAPRRLSADERKSIETHAMFMAREWLEKNGWSVEDTHLTKPFDFIARRGSELLYVEVKGTTTAGEAVILTRNEVAHHLAHPGQSCLILVRDIIMIPGESEPTCTGGVRETWLPWLFSETDLSALAYEYRLPRARGGAVAASGDGGGIARRLRRQLFPNGIDHR